MIAALLAAAAFGGSWSGSYVLPARAEPMPMRLDVRGSTGVVALGHGMAGRIEIGVKTAGGRVRFQLPGRPQPVAFDAKVTGGRLAGTVSQGPLRGSFVLRRGSAGGPGFTGVYRLADGSALGVFAPRDQLLGLDLATGEIHGLFPRSGGTYDVARGVVTRQPSAGTARIASGSIVYRGMAGTRLPLRYEQVRFRSGNVVLAGTLTLPAGAGPFPAVVLVHGSGPTSRDDQDVWASFLSATGFAVLAYDKRGIGESGGAYPGERARPSSIDVYARDAQAAAAFLAAQPEVDRARLGLVGSSQAGWIGPLAAARQPAIRFLVLPVGPTVTTDEQSDWQTASGGGSTTTTTIADAETQLRTSVPGGFDPLPSIRQLRIPALWLFAQNDRSVPTSLSVQRLEPVAREPGRDLSYVVFPGGSHSLVDTADGFNQEVEQADRFVPGLFSTLHDWLAARGIVG